MKDLSHHRIPVIVGVGEVIDPPGDLRHAREPAALMADALHAACRDAGQSAATSLLGALDSIDIVAQHSWPYTDPCGVLSDRLTHAPRRCAYGSVGGESPVRFIHEAALRIAAGENGVSAIVGAEAQYSVAAAGKQSFELPWSPRDPHARLVRGKDLCHPVAVRHGLTQPTHIYPLYENAATAAWGQTPQEARQESATLWADFSAVAATNPCAWTRQAIPAAEIAAPSADNRLIAWPYTRRMVANPFVNQGAAVLLTSLASARELNIADERLVYLDLAATAAEPRDYLQRDSYQRSSAQEAVLQRVLDAAQAHTGRFEAIELYSCFPIVPKMARRILGLSSDTPLTCTGGLSFFGAPLNNYMTHATAGLVRRLRGRSGSLGLLYGQGEFVTKHHALLLASSLPPQHRLDTGCVQAQADRRRGPIPELTDDYQGPARLETFTIVYDRDGAPESATVIALTPDRRRLMARVAAGDQSSLQVLTALNASPINRVGFVQRGPDDLLHWTVK